ncbi:MAG: transglutaminase family protein [Planctomycetota bacterium]
MMQLLRTICAILFLIPLGASSAQDSERYLIMQIDGERAGWMRESITRSEGRITSSAETRMSVKRGPIEISISFEIEFVETDEYEPISMRSKQVMGALPVETSYVFTDQGVEVTTVQSGRTTTRTQPAPDRDWVPPAKAAAIMQNALEEGRDSVEVTTLDPAFGLVPVTTTRTDIEPASIEVLGKTVPGFRATSTSSIAPGSTSTEFVDEQGRLLRSSTTFGGLEITMIAAEKELALADIDAPEMMQSTFISPKGTIRRPRETTEAVYLLTSSAGPLEDLPQTSSQRVERIDESTLRVRVKAESFTTEGGTPTDADLASSTMVACTDDAIVALVSRSGAAKNAPASVRAEAHRRFVHEFIDEKSLGVGFATASEVARTRVGDCTEHAALLAAVLRADGIPARVASGLIYVDSFLGSEKIFGYHMWTRAYIDTPDGRRWVDLDATLPDGTPFDATHITLDESTLSDDDAVNAMIALAPLMGRLEITIESIE